MTRPRLIALDLDGTLLRSDGTVSERARAALRAARARSLDVVIATARPPRALHPLGLDDGSVADEAICANGALLYDLVHHELVEERPISPDVVRRLVTDLRLAAPGVVFAAEAGLRFCREPGYAAGDPLDAPADETVVEDGLRFAERRVAKLLARHPATDLKLVLPLAQAIAADEAVVTRSTAGLLEISGPGVTKADALDRLCRRLGLGPSQVVAVGDHLNDLAMLRWAGASVAVANGHPDVLAIADEIVPANDEDGVALLLERLADAPTG